jgi:hypothetical protein
VALASGGPEVGRTVAGFETTGAAKEAALVDVLVAVRVGAAVGVLVAGRAVRAAGVWRFDSPGGLVGVGVPQLMSTSDSKKTGSIERLNRFIFALPSDHFARVFISIHDRMASSAAPPTASDLSLIVKQYSRFERGSTSPIFALALTPKPSWANPRKMPSNGA